MKVYIASTASQKILFTIQWLLEIYDILVRKVERKAQNVSTGIKVLAGNLKK